jgi:uncharacterized protein YjiS (DUF1127 family)
MSDRENQIEQDTQASIARRKALTKQFIAYEFEHETGKQVAKIKKKLNTSASSPLNNVVIDCDEMFVQGANTSVGSIIKTEAVNLRENYHTLNANNKAIVSLGLNSTLDISFTYPNSQSTLFTSQQWDELKRKYKPIDYDTNLYAYMRPMLQPIFKAYNKRSTNKTNWLKMYREVKSLERIYDHELNPKNSDISFCVYFMLQVLLLLKHQSGLFDSHIDSSEWDFIVKFWGPITERLFYESQLRLKWQGFFYANEAANLSFFFLGVTPI